MPKSRWKDIKRAESDTPEGNRIFEELRQECLESNLLAPESKNNDEQPSTADLEYGLSEPSKLDIC